MFKSTDNKGFQITFENGITISVQYGKGNYCANKNKQNIGYDGYSENEITSCKNAEICIWDKDNKEFEFVGSGMVKGWVNPNEVAQWIYNVSQAKDIESIINIS